jgi:diamine N-acetyltransferase
MMRKQVGGMFIMDEIAIKKLGITDAELLSKVALKAYADHYLHLWYDGGEWYMKKCFTVEQIATELSDPNASFYLAYYNGTAVGFLKLNIDATFEGGEDNNALELERIYLNKEATGKGIGSALVNFTFDIAKKNNKDLVWLKAMDSSEESISFYKKMGFEITGTYVLPHQLMKEELRGMVIMKKTL